MTTQAFITGEVARWEVIWWNRKQKRFTVKVFGNDLASAEELYARVLSAKKPFATLRCTNVGFPPPEKYRPYMKPMVRKETVRVRRKGKHVNRVKKTIVKIEVIPMADLNVKGAWWCPYCRKMRKFQRRDGVVFRDGGIEYYLPGIVFMCPVCEVTHTNHHVRKWNPQAQMLPFRKLKQTRMRRSSGVRKRRPRAGR